MAYYHLSVTIVLVPTILWHHKQTAQNVYWRKKNGNDITLIFKFHFSICFDFFAINVLSRKLSIYLKPKLWGIDNLYHQIGVFQREIPQ